MWYENSRNFSGVPWGHSRLRILHCHYCGEGSISSLGTFTCLGDNPPQKKKNSMKKEIGQHVPIMCRKVVLMPKEYAKPQTSQLNVLFV